MTLHTLKIMGRDVEIEVREPAVTPEQAAFEADLSEGIGDPRDAELAARVHAMSVPEFARFRREHGIGGKDLIDFLGGN
jgi:hypothetical protein